MTSSDRSSPGPGGQQPGDLPPGTVVSGYQIERVLGRGGMGTVYLAANPNLQRSEALKILSAQSSRDPEFRARFMREASLAASLTTPISSRCTTAEKHQRVTCGSRCSTSRAAMRIRSPRVGACR